MAPNSIPPLNSHSTALVLLPPPHIQSRINPIRSTNDKSFPRWTAHLTLVFPFVEPAHLPKAFSLVQDALANAQLIPFTFQLDKSAKFKQRDHDTLFLGPSKPNDVHRVWDVVSSAVGYSGRPFVPHLTLGQIYHRDRASTFLQDKAQLLLEMPIQWVVGSVVVLQKSEAENGLMKVYGEIPLSSDFSPVGTIAGLHPSAYQLSVDQWIPAPGIASSRPTALTLATYNILSDKDHPITPRLPLLLSTLLSISPIPDILCLQEVTDEFLRHLLANPSIRARWPLCTHDPTSVLPGKHNIVFLIRESLGVVWEYVPLHGRGKPAIALRLLFSSTASERVHKERSIVIAGLHLTAGLSPSQQQTKLQELETLSTFLEDRYPEFPWIIIGDTNIPTSQPIPASIMNSFSDVWLETRGSEDGGATFDPTSNFLASETVKADRSPQRYDRIWYRRDSGIQVQDVSQFGCGAEIASDHYGIAASLQLTTFPYESLNTLSVASGPSTPSTSPDRHERIASGIIAAFNDGDLQQFALHEGGFPTEAQNADRARVIAALQSLFSFPNRRSAMEADHRTFGDASDAIQLQSALRFEFVTVGSVGLGVDTYNSDTDILAIGNIPPSTFWSLARALLRKAMSQSRQERVDQTLSVILKRFVRDARVQMMELWVGNVQVDLQYCSGSKVLEKWDHIQELPPTDPLFLLPAASLRTLNAYRDMSDILRILPTSSHAVFRLAHRALKLFCVSHGIYSSRLGYLGGIHITLLLARTTLISPPHVSAMQLIAEFFAVYSNWDWGTKAVTLPVVGDEKSYARTPGREPMVILSINKPVENRFQNANNHTTNAIISTFKEANRCRLKGVPWSDICGSGGVCGDKFKAGFLQTHDSYIKVEFLFWGSSLVKARAWIRFMESRLPHLLVLLQTSHPSWNARLWPTRLVDGKDSGDLSTGTQSFYLIGLDSPVATTSVKNIQTSLLAFEDRLRRDERFYDASEMFVSVSQITPAQLPEAITAAFPWTDNGIDPDDELSDDEELLDSFDEDEDPDAAFASVSAKQRKNKLQHSSRGRSVTHVPAAKLRTSADVYNRLIWDRGIDSTDYLIGYEDRFAGLKEMPLVNWKREVEDEAFVPFHRVVHFRRKSDGVLVWDRRNKIDLVFGSGAGTSKISAT